MNQWRLIVAVAIVALGSGAIWVSHEGSQNADATPAPVVASAQARQSPIPVPEQRVVSDAVPPASSSPVEPASVAPENNESTTSAAVEPTNVDTPEPAERKFASGGRAEPDQN
jgi:hypothetical protein